jgi:hypothetical protein
MGGGISHILSIGNYQKQVQRYVKKMTYANKFCIFLENLGFPEHCANPEAWEERILSGEIKA